MDLSVGGNSYHAGLLISRPEKQVAIYFIDQPAFFDRAGMYSEGGRDYLDNAHRFIFFSKAVAHLARYLPWKPELVHVHDWQAGLVPLFILHQQSYEGWKDAPRTCLTIHNLAYQGRFARFEYPLTNLPLDYYTPDGVEYYGDFNSLKAGISYSTLISTVSPRYAREIATPEFGCGLDAVLRARYESLVGILNGVDYDEWNPGRDRFLRYPYTAEKLEGKTAGKLELQRELGLPAAANVPLFASITRLTGQKGVDLILGALEEMLLANMQFVMLGSGDTEMERAFVSLAKRFPAKMAVRIGFDQALSHRIEAGADFFLMPSRFEPCGLNQMYSQRYGTLPIVRVTGGLDDTVVDLTENEQMATGIKFHEFSVRALAKAIRKALVLFQHPDLLGHMRRNGMITDFSWEKTTALYVKTYQRALETGR
jgi:starch synthase